LHRLGKPNQREEVMTVKSTRISPAEEAARSVGGFNTGEAARLAHLPIYTLDQWDRSGFIKPSFQATTGSGHWRVYSFTDLICLRVASHLRAAWGLRLPSLRQIVKCIEEIQPGATLANAYLVVTEQDVLVKVGDEELISTLKQPGQSVMAQTVISLGGVIEELQQAIAV
jgi:DNA-binding transcriptional MerR regulator